MRNEPAPKRNEMARTSNAMRVRTIVLVAFFLIFGFGVLLYQLYVLQLRDVEKYRTEAVEQQLKDVTLPAARGSIYSATGKLLAKSNTVWNIIADPYVSANVDPSYLRQASDTIAGLLDDETITSDSIYERLTDSEKRYKVLAKNVEKPVADAIMKFAAGFRLPDAEGHPGEGNCVLSLWTEQASVRAYPYGAFLSSVLGFCDAQGSGFYGLEKSYEELLAGTPGRSVAATNVNGVVLDTDEAEVHEPIDGYNLHLTIDENVQAVVEEYLYKAVDDFSVKNRACAIVMNVKTGAIYAMASIEQFDPNDPYAIYDETMRTILENGVLDAATTEILQQRLGESETAEIVADGRIDEEEYSTVQGMMREAQWKNKNISELYYPGSVFKLVTASAALDSGLAGTEQSYQCTGEYIVDAGTDWEHAYGCALRASHGWLDMAGALNHSCNIYFIQLSQLLSPTVFYDYIQAFGFTQATGIDLPAESRWMIIHDADAMEQIKTNLYSQSFGQNLAITPLQMATAVAAVANGGYLVTPYVVDTVTDSGGNVVKKTETAIRRQVISEEVSKSLLAMMENNVNPNGEGDYHSCKNAYVAGYRIGAKSGTSEELNRSLRPTDGDYRKAMSLAAVLPVDDPEIEVFVMLEDPRWIHDYASDVVAPIVGNIISEIAPYLGIAQDSGYNPTGEVTVQTCLGYSWTNAQVTLNLLGLNHKIIGTSAPGDTILYQYPYGGTTVPAGSTVYLYTNSTADQMAAVPDATGKTGSFAKQMLQAAGLNAQIEGDPSARVTAQSVEADSSVPLGTVVTLTTAADPAPEQTPAGEPQPEAADAGEPAQ